MVKIDSEGTVHDIEIDGTFGDKSVIISKLSSGRPGAPVVTVLHGVYGCANLRVGNKYGDLARLLSASGADVCVVETSRMRRDRESFDRESEKWITEAFEGKTFSMELDDACSACREVAERHPGRRMWLWGFSLGGLLAALSIAGAVPDWFEDRGIDTCGHHVEALVIAGASDMIRPSERHRLRMPILDLPLAELAGNPLREVVPRLNTQRMASFYGTEDDTFTEESCRDFISNSPLPESSRRFVVLDGVDHSFNLRHGKPDRSILSEMVNALSDWLM